jgi:DNA-binding Lrp family transcriptional regulator
MIELDDLYRRILKELLRDSRRSYRELARRLNVAVTTIINRIQRMEESGIITGYPISVDYEKLGYELTVLTEISVSKGKLLEMEKEIAKMPCVCAVYDVTGVADGMVIAKFKTRKELSDFTKGLLSMPFIERTNTHVVLTTVKEDFRLMDAL